MKQIIGILLAAASVVAAAAPGIAQTADTAPSDLTTMVPLPDLQGIDPDLICFAVSASSANDAKKAGKPDAMLDSAAGYYAGRLSMHFVDNRAGLRAQVAKLLTQFATRSADPFKVPCLQRYGVSLTGIMAALQGGQTDAK